MFNTKSIFQYINKNWPQLIFWFVLLNWALGMIKQPFGVLILGGTIALYFIAGYLSKKVFRLDKGGQIPWYGSPVFWLGMMVLLVLVYGLVQNT
jgi:hypothetical protein